MSEKFEFAIIPIKELREIIREEMSSFQPLEPDITRDRLTRAQAAKLAGVSLPTFAKMIKSKMFSSHGFGRNKFFLRSEIIKALKNEAD